MVQILGWLGRHAPVVLIVGCDIAFVFPDLALIIRPALPVLVSMVLGSSMAQLKPRELFPDILEASRLPALVAIAGALMPATSLAYALIFGLIGISQRSLEFAVILAAAAPIASAAALCRFTGLNSRCAGNLACGNGADSPAGPTDPFCPAPGTRGSRPDRTCRAPDR